MGGCDKQGCLIFTLLAFGGGGWEEYWGLGAILNEIKAKLHLILSCKYLNFKIKGSLKQIKKCLEKGVGTNLVFS